MQIDTTVGFCCVDDFCKTYEAWERAERIGVFTCLTSGLVGRTRSMIRARSGGLCPGQFHDASSCSMSLPFVQKWARLNF